MLNLSAARLEITSDGGNWQQALLQAGEGTGALLIALSRGHLDQLGKQVEEFLVDILVLFLDDRRQGLIIGDRRQTLDQVDPALLAFDLLFGDPVFLQDPLDQTLKGQGGLRAEQVAFALLRGQIIDHLLEQTADHLFLLIARQVQFRGNERQQEFLGRIVIDERRRQGAIETAVGALGHIHLTRQQFVLGCRVGAEVKNLLDIRRNQLAALGAFNLCSWHDTLFI